MRDQKKKRLESKGWKVGTAEEFLDLSPEESAYIELKLALSRTLRERREKSALTQEELAEIVAVTRKTINTIENRKYIPSTYLALKLAQALETSVEDLFQIES